MSCFPTSRWQPNPGDRNDQLRLPGFALDLSSQPTDEHVDAAIESFRVPAGDRFEQVIAAEGPAWIGDEGEQQIEFRPPQRDTFTARINEGAGRRIERKAFE